MKKVLALILALVLCVGILAGCEQKPAETSKPTDAPKPTETQKPQETTQATEPPVTEYTFPAGAKLDVYSGNAASGLDGTPLDKFIEEATGLNILWQVAPQDGGIQALLTEKVTPSLVFTTGRANINEMGRYGAYVNLWDYQDIMPNFFAHFNAEENAAFKESYMVSEDELYAAPVYQNGDVQRYGWMYREDIFKELNLEVPTNWETFLDVCRKLKAAYPDSYPFTMRQLDGVIAGFGELAQQWGVNYFSWWPSHVYGTEKYYNANTTDEMRYMLQCIRQLIDEGLMDIAALSYDTAMWQESFTSGASFITHDKAFQLDNLEGAGKQANPNFSLSWFNNIPMVESDLPYATRDQAVSNYCWFITSRCPDIELACRYLDWLYSEEGSRICSWGVEGESYTVDANGNKQYVEGFDTTFMARYQESGWVDFTATMASYTDKNKEMILDTMAAAKAGGFMPYAPVTLNPEEQTVVDTYLQSWLDNNYSHLQQFMLGKLDINDDAVWQAYKDSCIALNEAEIIAAYESAYARYLAGEQ